jgi:DNA mismatch repair ATPase MutL
MKVTHLFAFTLAAALTAAPTFAQEPDKTSEAPRAHENAPAEKEKSVKPENGSMKTQEAGQEKTKDARHESKLPQSDQEPGVANPERERQQSGSHERQENQSEAKRGNGGDRADTGRHAEYHFKGDEKAKLRSSYHDINRIDRSHRVTITREQVLPVEVRTRIEPVPVEVVSYLPPPPEGYLFGFVDGYCVVYDPNTFLVVDVIDLL